MVRFEYRRQIAHSVEHLSRDSGGLGSNPGLVHHYYNTNHIYNTVIFLRSDLDGLAQMLLNFLNTLLNIG